MEKKHLAGFEPAPYRGDALSAKPVSQTGENLYLPGCPYINVRKPPSSNSTSCGN